MPDVFTSEKRSEVMRKIKSKNTKPEMQVRRALHALGYRYRLHVKSLPGTPDIVLRKYKTVIQIQGCFWHGHNCKIAHTPKSNQEYWLPKIERNIRRDQENNAKLAEQGWKEIIVWECSCRKKNLFIKEIQRILDVLSG